MLRKIFNLTILYPLIPYAPNLSVAENVVRETGLIARTDTVLQILYAGQLVCQFRKERTRNAVLAHAHRFGDVLQRILRDEVVFRLAQQKPDRRVILLCF